MKWLAGVCIAAVVLPQIIVGWGAEEAAVGRAIKLLEKEVASWRKENGCYSCHNNGDGARALFLAGRRGNKIEAGALSETTAWLNAPGKWHENKGDPGFSDKRLPVIQFGAALAASAATNEESLRSAAEMIGKEQEADGSWKIEGQRDIGSPAAYGNDLATSMAVLVLEQASAREKGGVEKGRRWFRGRKIQNGSGGSERIAGAGE